MPFPTVVILLNVVKRSGNYVVEDGTPPGLRTRDLSYALGAYKVFIESVVM